MVQRSTIEANVAAHHIATWEAHIATTPAPCGAGRKASVPCPEYAEWRLKMRHNYRLTSSRTQGTLALFSSRPCTVPRPFLA